MTGWVKNHGQIALESNNGAKKLTMKTETIARIEIPSCLIARLKT
jgi:hypothetical protein